MSAQDDDLDFEAQDNRAASLTEDGIFDVDGKPQPKKPEPVTYQVYEDSRIAVSRATGKMWETKYRAALAANEHIYTAWDQVFQYYNNDQSKTLSTPRGKFKRGDSTENVVYSNINVLLPATYSKNPDVTCNTSDAGDQDFCECLETLLNTLFRQKGGIDLKPKLKRAIGFGLLTNQGVLKLDYIAKDDSAEVAVEQLAALTAQIPKAKNQEELANIYGQLAALEEQMSISEPSGFKLYNVISQNLILDPYAEMPDGTDGTWMMERVFLPTEYLNARYTRKDGDGRVLIYRPTHKVDLKSGDRDDGLGVVLEAINADANLPTSHTSEERLSYIYTYMTECVYVWDRTTKRVLLFQKDDWSWPLWVWDDPLKINRFFPYFVISFGMSTGGAVSVGETSYYLDQQDEINDINRQLSRIRRTIFDYWFYNSDKVKPDEIEPLLRAIRGDGSPNSKKIVGLRAGENKLTDVVETVKPPSIDYAALFNKDAIFSGINRISNISDALRGAQFKTNTNEKAVESYQDAARLSIGAKIDSIEDCVSDLARAIAEIAVQRFDKQDVAALIGPAHAQAWREMSVEQFRAEYNVDIVAGSTEKPNSQFKKKEAIQIAQAVGQFAQAAPGSAMKIMLKTMEKAFTEVSVTDEDWESIDKEIVMNAQKAGAGPQGAGTNGAQPGQAPPGGASPQAQQPNAQVEQLLAQADPQTKQRAAQAAQNGATQQQVLQILTAKTAKKGNNRNAARPSR